MIELDEIPPKPKGAQYWAFGLWHKLGVHGKVMYWADGWFKSDKNWSDVVTGVDGKERRI